MTRTLRAAYCGLLFSGILLAQSVTIGGDIPQPVTLTKETLAKMPRISVSWSEHGPAVNYEGVSLYEILKAAGAPLDKQLSGKALAVYVLAEAKDGYQVVFTLPEVDPAFTDDKILLADTANGEPLDDTHGPFRVVVPHDKKGARSIRMLEKITVVRLRK
jgi:DMSO/TMAO reductase YedYZ molybdopterin-dependent catalytic subunit